MLDLRSEPFALGLFGVFEGIEIYWEVSGNLQGNLALYLHVGPESSLRSGIYRQLGGRVFFDVSRKNNL